METVVKFGPPFVLSNPIVVWAFLLFPGVLAALGARLCQGSFLRIVGAAFGAVVRDLGILILVSAGLLKVTNPLWIPDISLVLAFFCGSGAALFGCLTPYRGPLVPTMAFIGGFGGQFVLAYLMGMQNTTTGEWEVVRSVLMLNGL